MKNIFKRALVCLAALGLAACSSDFDEFDSKTDINNSAQTAMTFSAEYPASYDGLSKTLISGSSVLFDGGEKIAVYSNQYKTGIFTNETTDGGASAKFSGSIDTTGATSYYAVMPSSAAVDLHDDIFSVRVPSTQVVGSGQTVDPEAQVMVAKTSASKLAFHFLNVCSYFKVTTTEPLKSITLKSNGGSIAGTVKADANTGEITGFEGGLANTITILPKGRYIEPGTYQIAILPGSINGFSITLTEISGSSVTKTSSKTLTMQRQHIKSLGTISVPGIVSVQITGGPISFRINSIGGNKPNIEWSINGGEYEDVGHNKHSGFKAGDVISFRGINPKGFSKSDKCYTSIVIDGEGTVSFGGSLMALIDGVGDVKEIPNPYCFFRIFAGSTALVNIPNIPGIVE